MDAAIRVEKVLEREDYNVYDGKHKLIKYRVLHDPNGIYMLGDPIWVKDIPDRKQLRLDI